MYGNVRKDLHTNISIYGTCIYMHVIVMYHRLTYDLT